MRVEVLRLTDQLGGDAGAGDETQDDPSAHPPWRVGPPVIQSGADVVAERGTNQQHEGDGSQ